MTSEQLQYLIMLKKYPSYSSAAEKLHISFQAYAKAIHRLESELNLNLVKSSAKGTHLTEDGIRIANAASTFFNEIDLIQHEKKFSSSTYDKKKITIPMDLMNLVSIKPWLLSVREKYPFLELEKISYHDIFKRLHYSDCPFALISQICMDDFFFKHIPAGYKFIKIDSEPIIVYTSGKNRFAKDSHDLFSFDGLPLIIAQKEHEEIFKLIFPNSEILVEDNNELMLDLIMKYDFFSLSSIPFLNNYKKKYDIRSINTKNRLYHSIGILKKDDYPLNVYEEALFKEFFKLSY